MLQTQVILKCTTVSSSVSAAEFSEHVCFSHTVNFPLAWEHLHVKKLQSKDFQALAVSAGNDVSYRFFILQHTELTK